MKPLIRRGDTIARENGYRLMESFSLGSFLYYSPSQNLYVAGTIDQTDDNVTALLLMIKAMCAVAHSKNS